MVLNKGARKEAENRCSMLRRAVEIYAFTHRFEDDLCRQVRQTAEELAELSSRIVVEINEATEAGDLLRKYRIDSLPALVLTGKDMPEVRVYGMPMLYGFEMFLDILVNLGNPGEPKEGLVLLFQKQNERSHATIRSALPLDLVVSRRDPLCKEAMGAVWRVLYAEQVVFESGISVPSIRILEDNPRWMVPGSQGLPVLHIGSERIIFWPFSDEDIAQRME